MRSILLLLPGLLACETATQPPLPWVRGLTEATASDRATSATMRRLADVRDEAPGCELAAHEGVELHADVSPRPGRETIVASYAQGILVFDREDQLVASTPGYPCSGGSADSIEIVAAGSAWGDRTLVVVGTTGGHGESDTWLSLFHIAGDRLQASFTGIVEERRGEEIQRGSVWLLPDALLYRRPGGEPALYLYDPVPGVFMPPHHELDHGEDDGPLGPVSRR